MRPGGAIGRGGMRGVSGPMGAGRNDFAWPWLAAWDAAAAWGGAGTGGGRNLGNGIGAAGHGTPRWAGADPSSGDMWNGPSLAAASWGGAGAGGGFPVRSFRLRKNRNIGS